ncbi:hypothetical protein F5H01DRAFT_383530, partial [Linnemannia elongata]
MTGKSLSSSVGNQLLPTVLPVTQVVLAHLVDMLPQAPLALLAPAVTMLLVQLLLPPTQVLEVLPQAMATFLAPPTASMLGLLAIPIILGGSIASPLITILTLTVVLAMALRPLPIYLFRLNTIIDECLIFSQMCLLYTRYKRISHKLGLYIKPCHIV